MSLPIKKPSVRVINQAARIIKAGGIVAFPTETVYGLGANAYNIAAVKKIFNLKGRPNDNPIIIHIADHRDLARVARNIPQIAYRLVAKFWPGPLTLVLKKSSSIPRIVTAGRDTVAVRMPKSKIAIALIKKSGVPIAAPSANRSGRPSPVTARHVYEDFGAAAPMIIDGGQSRIGLESTVLDLTQKSPTLLRFGLITKKDIERCLGVKIKEYSGQPKRPASPGLKYRHYAPQARVLIIANKPKLLQQAKLLTSAGQRVGIVTTSDWQPKLTKVHLFRLGSKTNLRQAASKIFTIFRTADRKKINTLLIRPVSRVGIGQAIMDRLNRASQK